MKTKILIALIVFSLLGGGMNFSPASAQGDWGIEKGNLGLPETGRHEGEAAVWDYATPRAERMRSKEQGGFNCSQVVALGYLESECEALVALYQSTNGANWANNSDWLSNPDLNEWYGVGVLELSPSEKVVDEIVLYCNQLSGSIPAELGQLKNLELLGLNDNQLSGSIPAELGQLTNLELLVLERNQLSGGIPTELGGLTELRHLVLDNNQLSDSIPAELGNLTNLQFLYLNNNQLSGSMPGELGNLTNLETLDLSYNQLNGSIPAEIGSLTALRHLDLSHNHLWGNVPASITNLTGLCVNGLSIPGCSDKDDTDFGYNMLFVPQPEPPQSFMNTKDPDWADTQNPPIRTYLPMISKGQ